MAQRKTITLVIEGSDLGMLDFNADSTDGGAVYNDPHTFQGILDFISQLNGGIAHGSIKVVRVTTEEG